MSPLSFMTVQKLLLDEAASFFVICDGLLVPLKYFPTRRALTRNMTATVLATTSNPPSCSLICPPMIGPKTKPSVLIVIKGPKRPPSVSVLCIRWLDISDSSSSFFFLRLCRPSSVSRSARKALHSVCVCLKHPQIVRLRQMTTTELDGARRK